MIENLAQTLPGVDTAATIAQYGIPSVILAWFMVRCEAKLNRIDSSLTIMSKVLALFVSNHAVNETIKEQAADILKEIADHEAEARKHPGDKL